jgi:hypothetical protein
MLWLDFGPMLHGIIQHGFGRTALATLGDDGVFGITNSMMVIGLAHPEQ